MQNVKFDFDDILLEPTIISEISSRKEINPFDESGMLPIFASPMIDVVTMASAWQFYNNKIIPILARSTFDLNALEDITENNYWVAVSLKEYECWYGIKEIENKPINKTIYILIDIANGHMKELVDIVKRTKEKYGDKIQLMVGNVANPLTYKNLSMAGADYIRIGIGNGGVCVIAGTKIKTKDGLKNIEDVEIGDFVLTHTGEYQEVIATHKKMCNKNELIKINDSIVTEDHEYYVVNKKYANIINDDNYMEYAEWISAKKLNKDEYFLLEIE